jgi:hypothetical protein
MAEKESAVEKARRQADEDRAAGIEPVDISEVFERDSDNFAKYTTRLPKYIIADLKQRALDERKTPAKLITEALDELLSRPARDPDAAEEEQQRSRMIT